MYTPAHFAEARPEVLCDFIRSHPLGALISVSEQSGIVASHIPMLLDTGAGVLRCHMARANPHWRSLALSSVLVIFTGPQHYISPSWYKSKEEHGKVVPTWNYAAVHVTGRAHIFEDGDPLYEHLSRLTAANETAHGLSWRIDDAPRPYIDALLRSIVGIEISVSRIEGKWKMSQNRPEQDREGVISALDLLGTHTSLDMSSAMKMRR
jgi:transcriptional regulator